MCAEFLIRKKLARISPEGLPAIRLVGLRPDDDEKFMHAVERRFAAPGVYGSILEQDFITMSDEEQRSLLRSIAHMKRHFEYRRYSENPNWFDIVPQNLPPGILKEYVPTPWYKILTVVSHDLGYPLIK